MESLIELCHIVANFWHGYMQFQWEDRAYNMKKSVAIDNGLFRLPSYKTATLLLYCCGRFAARNNTKFLLSRMHVILIPPEDILGVAAA